MKRSLGDLVSLVTLRSLVTLAALLLPACGGRVEGAAQDGAGTTGGADPGDPSWPGGGASSEPPSSSSGSSSGSSPTWPAPSGSRPDYMAFAYSGGLEHVDVYRMNLSDDTCVHVHLVNGGPVAQGAPFAGIAVPAGWRVASADRSLGATSCRPHVTRPPVQSAETGGGSVTWKTTSFDRLPCSIDIDVSLAFDADPSPATRGMVMDVERLSAKAVPVSGCR